MATYLILNMIVLVFVAVVFVRRKTFTPSWLKALVGLMIMTAIFDNVIVGSNIVGYDSAKILGIRVGVAPIEDFFYALVAVIIVPALWNRGDSRG